MPTTAGEPSSPRRWSLASVGAALVNLPRRLTKLRPQDISASISGAITSVPDGMAGGVMAGVSPINGLYASIVGPIIGGLTVRTPLLVISTTSATALAVAEVTNQYEGDERLQALLLLTFLAGLVQVGVSLLHPVKITSFVSHSVMTGFLMGIATLVVLRQLGNFVGYEPSGSNAVFKTADVIVNLQHADPASVVTGCLTLALVFVATRLHLASVSALIALAAVSFLVPLLGWDSVATVSDIASIPSGFPLPSIPDLSFFTLPILVSALSLGAITFVQTVGVSQSLPGDNTPTTQSGDIRASGLANIGVSLFQGQPVGGSMGQSAMNLQSGGRTRAASVLIGLWVLLIVLLLGPLVEVVPMPSLAALLMIAGVAAINVREAISIWRTGWASRLTITTTFLLTLLLPIQYAVLAGIGLSVVLYLMSAAEDVRLKRLQVLPGGLRETEAPAALESASVLVLDVYGSLFYAGARTLERRLPRVGDAEQAVVILRLRGRTSVGATAVAVLAGYAGALRANHGRLYLAGLDKSLEEQLQRSNKLRLLGVRLYPAYDFIGRSVSQSYEEAEAWLAANPMTEVA